MLNDLLTFFIRAPQNRRRYQRRSGPFPAWVAQGSTWATVTCVDISGSGMGVVSTTSIGPEVNVRIALEKRNILVRAKRVWQLQGVANGKPAWRYGLTFTGIGADDWDAIVRFCNNAAVAVENKAQQELQLVRMQPDDVARLIPKKLQDHLLAMLVQRGRLAPLNEKIPLVAYSYGGVLKRGGKTLHRVSIHSRITDSLTGEVKSHDTRFTFDDEGGNVAIDE